MGIKEHLQKDRGKRTELPSAPAYNDNEDQEETGSSFWGKERSATRRAVMLDLRLKGGEYVSLPYSYLTKIKFNPSEALELYISGNHVKITGRNLHEIYNQLCRHRVTFIQANIIEFDNTEENNVFISTIIVTKET